MAALRDKVWAFVDGKKYRADVVRIEGDDLSTDEIDVNLIVTTPPDEGGVVHNVVHGGASKLKLAKSESEQKVDGHWWPRSGSWVADPAHGGRKRWEGE